jgi:hypothetical protein
MIEIARKGSDRQPLRGYRRCIGRPALGVNDVDAWNERAVRRRKNRLRSGSVSDTKAGGGATADDAHRSKYEEEIL